MSGESGADLDSTYYALFIGTGVCVSYEPPPGDDGSAIGRYFEEESQPYRAWLLRAKPALDALFEEVHAEGTLPLVPFGGASETIDGTIIEDVGAREDRAEHFRQYHRGGPCTVSVSGDDRMPDGQSLNLRLLVSARVSRKALEALLDRVAAVLGVTRQG